MKMTLLPPKFRHFAIPLIALCLFAATASDSQAQSLNEDSLKANYLLRFVDFVRWEKPKTGHSKIGVLNEPSLYRELKSIAADKSTPTRSFEIVEIDANAPYLDQAKGLDMIYVGRGQKKRWSDIVTNSRQEATITVSSETGFMDSGGLIEFVTLQNRLRFALNLIEVDSYNLGVSSKLAQLAVR
ncbi:YfiR family protein [Pelagicoccus sp. SDUM812005]|uniref:YfiR family protein n=1 Tax=Pelagicoccus sp. SDUM812005 TaxID=3041257 RepID=UPI00280D52FF|nr:YfiR family protein [Pelagicoccus sp. SDUM812005]MDQ8179375.1 YfiR family protein [Pelagicoccus sp. SDUM812005]